MIARAIALLGAALLVGAASPTQFAPLALGGALLEKHATGLRAMPPPALPPMSTFTPAPVPNLDLQAAGAPPQTGVQVTPNLFNQLHTYQGEGFTPNSTVEGEYQRRILPTPGLNLSVPLN